MLHVGHRRLYFSKNKVDLMHLSGLSLTGLAAGPVIGFSQSPRTVLKFKYDLDMQPWGTEAIFVNLCEQIAKAVEVYLHVAILKYFKILQEDIMASYY